jgi:DNA recombination protein RmuC
MEDTYIYTILAFIAGGVATYIATLAKTGKDKKEIAEQGEVINILKKEVNDANIKRIQAEERLTMQKELLTHEQESHKQAIEQMKEQNNLTLENIKNELSKSAEESFKQRSEELKSTNIEQLAHILSPMREQMSKMEESVRKVNTSSAEHKASIEKTIEGLAQQTIKVGEHADELAKALKSNSKVQGDWGEQMLETILDNSGLRKGYEYTVQENFKDGKRD